MARRKKRAYPSKKKGGVPSRIIRGGGFWGEREKRVRKQSGRGKEKGIPLHPLPKEGGGGRFIASWSPGSKGGERFVSLPGGKKKKEQEEKKRNCP